MCSLKLRGGVDTPMQVRNVARRIERYGGAYNFSLSELEGFQGDLFEAERRLLNGLYGGVGVGKERIADRTEELFGDVGFYWSAGQVWRELLTAVGAKLSGLSVEVGCGVVPKVGGALHYLEFEGALDLVDVSEESLEYASRWLTLLGCRFPRRSVRSHIFELGYEIYDGVFANHAIDDLILHEHCVRSGSSTRQLYLDGGSYGEAWLEISRDSEWIPSFVEMLVRAIVSALAPGGTVVMCDYQSHSHTALGLDYVTSLVRDVQAQVRKGLRERGLRSLDTLVPLHLHSDRFELGADDVIAFQKGEVS